MTSNTVPRLYFESSTTSVLPSLYCAISVEPSSRTSSTSSDESWTWAVTTSGLTWGTAVTAWRTSRVCVPFVLDQLAFLLPFISRSSDRG